MRLSIITIYVVSLQDVFYVLLEICCVAVFVWSNHFDSRRSIWSCVSNSAAQYGCHWCECWASLRHSCREQSPCDPIQHGVVNTAAHPYNIPSISLVALLQRVIWSVSSYSHVAKLYIVNVNYWYLHTVLLCTVFVRHSLIDTKSNRDSTVWFYWDTCCRQLVILLMSWLTSVVANNKISVADMSTFC